MKFSGVPASGTRHKSAPARWATRQGHRQSRVVVITSFLDRWSDAEEVEDLV